MGAGAVEHSQLVDLAGKAFGGLPSGGPSTEELVAKARPRAHPPCSGLHSQCGTLVTWRFLSTNGLPLGGSAFKELLRKAHALPRPSPALAQRVLACFGFECAKAFKPHYPVAAVPEQISCM